MKYRSTKSRHKLKNLFIFNLYFSNFNYVWRVIIYISSSILCIVLYRICCLLSSWMIFFLSHPLCYTLCSTNKNITYVFFSFLFLNSWLCLRVYNKIEWINYRRIQEIEWIRMSINNDKEMEWVFLQFVGLSWNSRFLLFVSVCLV